MVTTDAGIRSEYQWPDGAGRQCGARGQGRDNYVMGLKYLAGRATILEGHLYFIKETVHHSGFL
jgi:hypothetical protein